MGDAGIVVGHLADLAAGQAMTVPAAVTGTVDDIAVFNDGGEVFALDATCSHQQASLAEGWIEDGTVECPLHSAAFCLRDGSALSLPATTGVTPHRVSVEDGEIRVYPNPTSLAS